MNVAGFLNLSEPAWKRGDAEDAETQRIAW
jgi:hypothetical protein